MGILGLKHNRSKGSSKVVAGPRRKEHLIEPSVFSSFCAVAEINPPKLVDMNDVPVGVFDRSHEPLGQRVESVDCSTVCIVRDQQRIA